MKKEVSSDVNGRQLGRGVPGEHFCRCFFCFHFSFSLRSSGSAEKSRLISMQ
jgi:hypothetical protein